MNKTLGLGILGCGDFLRLNCDELKASRLVHVAALFDPDRPRAERYAAELGGRALDNASAVVADPEVQVLLIFSPPWVRAGLFTEAAQAGKPILTTKPLAPDTISCAAIQAAAQAGGIPCGVIYNRTGNAAVQALKRLFVSGEVGRLALYRQDWIHHYPQWNAWAIDPKKNGGPFMDAMIHNLNIARHLMGREPSRVAFFSDNLSHPQLPCADTEAMKVDFDGNGTGLLFITWAADLAVHSTAGNDREHIDLFYCVTDQGWRVTLEDQPGGGQVIAASRRGERKQWPVPPFSSTVYDEFAAHLQQGTAWPERLPDLREAAMDIQLITQGTK